MCKGVFEKDVQINGRFCITSGLQLTTVTFTIIHACYKFMMRRIMMQRVSHIHSGRYSCYTPWKEKPERSS